MTTFHDILAARTHVCRYLRPTPLTHYPRLRQLIAPLFFTIITIVGCTAVSPTATPTPLPATLPSDYVFEPAVLLDINSSVAQAVIAQRQTDQATESRDYYLNHAECDPGPDWELDTSSLAAFEESIEPWRLQFLDALNLGALPPASTPTVHLRETVLERDGVRFEYVILQSRYEGVTVHGYLLTPLATPPEGGYPVVIAQHGTGDYPELLILRDTELARGFHYRELGSRLVEAGFVVFAPYIPRSTAETEQYAHLGSGGTSIGLPLQKLISVVDFLEVQPNINPAQIGIYGLSWGGQLAMWLAAVDTRIKATVVSSFARDFSRWVYERDDNTLLMDYDASFISPFFWCQFDTQRVGVLIAPRYSLYEYGSRDQPVISTGGSETDEGLVTDSLIPIEEVYETLGIGDRFQVVRFQGSHRIDGQAAIPWLVQTLTNSR